MDFDDMPLDEGAVVGYNVNRLGYQPSSAALTQLLEEILASVQTEEPPSDEELAVLLHAEAIGMGFSPPITAQVWMQPEHKRAGFFSDIEAGIEEGLRCGLKPAS